MVEAQEGFANLKDVDEATFIRFIEWAYKGYYTAAEFVQVKSPRTSGRKNHDKLATTFQEASSFSQGGDEVAPASQEAYSNIQPAEVEFSPPAEAPQDLQEAVADFVEVDDWTRPSQANKKGKKGKRADDWGMTPEAELDMTQVRKRDLKEAFISRKYTIRQTLVNVQYPRPNQKSKEDYTPVFLSHARLYVFADMYDIQQLKVLALEELHATLAAYRLYQKRTGDIIALLEYVYGGICKREKSDEGMRELMTQYVGREMDILVDDKEFKDLLEDGGPLLSDFIKMAARIMKG